MAEPGKKFREHQNWEEQVDGSTLEKRRDQRAEILERYLGSLTPDDRRGVLGLVNQWTQAEGVKVVPNTQSVYDLSKKQKQIREFSDTKVFDDLPPIVKRSPNERVESMVKRLLTATPESVEPMLTQIAGEYWKAGSPVTVDALRAVATHFLNRNERRRA